MIIALILATMFCSFVAGVSFIGGSLALLDQPLLNKWSFPLVNLLDRLMVGPLFALAGVRTSHWPVRARAKACIVLGIGTGVLTLVLGDLASRSGP